MSGYCLECGNDLCICSELEEEAKKQPDVMFICQRKEIEKLQEKNKTMREALEFYANGDNWVSDADNSPDFYDCIDDDFDKCNEDGYRFECGGKRAREALAKVNNEV